jgi:hypothetical protein
VNTWPAFNDPNFAETCPPSPPGSLPSALAPPDAPSTTNKAELTPDGTVHDCDPPVSENVHVTVLPDCTHPGGNAADAEPANATAQTAHKPTTAAKTPTARPRPPAKRKPNLHAPLETIREYPPRCRGERRPAASMTTRTYLIDATLCKQHAPTNAVHSDTGSEESRCRNLRTQLAGSVRPSV